MLGAPGKLLKQRGVLRAVILALCRLGCCSGREQREKVFPLALGIYQSLKSSRG